MDDLRNISKVQLEEEVFNIKDAYAREQLEQVSRGSCEFLEEMRIQPIAFMDKGFLGTFTPEHGSNPFYQPQGSQYYERGGKRYLASIMLGRSRDASGVAQEEPQATKIIEIDLDGDGRSIARSNIHDYGHGNGMTIYNDLLLVARGGGSAINQQGVDVVALSDFEYKSTIQCVPDPEEYKNDTVQAVCYANDRLYCLTSIIAQRVHVYTLSSISEYSFSAVYEKTIPIDYRGANNWQGLLVDKELIYILSYRGSASSPSQGIDGVAVYYMDGRSKSFVKSMCDLEIEDISAYGNNYMFTAYTNTGCLVFSAKIKQNSANLGRFSDVHENQIFTADQNLNVWIDSTVTTIFQTGTQERPFKYFQIFEKCCLYDFYTSMSLNIYGDFSGYNLSLQNLNKLRIINIRGAVQNLLYKLGSLYIGSGNVVYIDGCYFNGYSEHNAQLYVREVELYAENCYFEGAYGRTNGIFGESARITVTTCAFYNLINGVRAVRNSMLNIGNNVEYRSMQSGGLYVNADLQRLNTYKRLVMFGDSIARGSHNSDSIGEQIMKKVRCKYDNHAYAGARYVVGGTPTTDRLLQNQLNKVSKNDFDVAIVICGVNDFRNGVSRTYFELYCESTISWIASNYQDNVVLVCTPFKCKDWDVPGQYGDTLEYYANVIKLMCEKYSVMCYDCFNDPAMDYSHNELLTANGDGLHPTDKMLERIVPTLCNKLF